MPHGRSYMDVCDNDPTGRPTEAPENAAKRFDDAWNATHGASFLN